MLACSLTMHGEIQPTSIPTKAVAETRHAHWCVSSSATHFSTCEKLRNQFVRVRFKFDVTIKKRRKERKKRLIVSFAKEAIFTPDEKFPFVRTPRVSCPLEQPNRATSQEISQTMVENRAYVSFSVISSKTSHRGKGGKQARSLVERKRPWN